MESQKLYDCMAEIIRQLLDEGFDVDTAYAIDKDCTENMLVEAGKLLEEDSFSLTNSNVLQDINLDAPYFLVFLLQKLDETAHKQREQELWDKPDFEAVRCINSLNDKNSIEKTNILIIPRYTCIWEGKSRDRHHVTNINTFLHHSFCVETSNGKIEGRYTVKNHIMNPQYFGICMDNKNELSISLAVSPLTDEVQLEVDKYQDGQGPVVNYFTVNLHHTQPAAWQAAWPSML